MPKGRCRRPGYWGLSSLWSCPCKTPPLSVPQGLRGLVVLVLQAQVGHLARADLLVVEAHQGLVVLPGLQEQRAHLDLAVHQDRQVQE